MCTAPEYFRRRDVVKFAFTSLSDMPADALLRESSLALYTRQCRPEIQLQRQCDFDHVVGMALVCSTMVRVDCHLGGLRTGTALPKD